MIQKTSQRLLNAVRADTARPSTDRPEHWGQWVGNRHYSLEVSQQPIRARMCGFGDKDRRPLAPAAVAKMTVRREDNSILDVDDVDVDFFVVTVDLWSADGTQEMNLVLHPNPIDRHVPPFVLKARQRSAAAAAAVGGSPAFASPLAPSRLTRPVPYPSPADHPRPQTAHPNKVDLTLTSTAPLIAPPTSPTFPSAFPFPASHPPGPFGPPIPHGASAPWSFDSPRVTPLPSIHALGTRPSPALPDPPFDPDLTPFRPWDDAAPSFFDPDTRWPAEPFALPTATEPWSVPAPAPPAPVPVPTPVSMQRGDMIAPPLPPSQRHPYTRTLVGPLCANAQRLQDEHRKPGIFFLFQDLSIRTEGTFRLRMRLMNVGISPAPNGLANSVHTSVSPVLAQIFTEPFTVYSAKRFPGVPDTTALSIAFGNQGQKLPLRNRHGPSKQQQRPSRRPIETQFTDDDSS